MKCEKCGANLNPNNYCPICGTVQQVEIDKNDTSAYFAKFKEMQVRKAVSDLPKFKPITIGKTKIDVRFAFILIAVSLIIAFFLPYYYMEFEIWETHKTTMYDDDGNATGGIDTTLVEVRETASGSVIGWWFARLSPDLIGDMLWGVLVLPILIIIAIFVSLNRVDLNRLYSVFIWAFGIIISLAVFEYIYFFHDITTTESSAGPGYFLVRATSVNVGEGDWVKVAYVIPTIGWIATVILCVAGILFAKYAVKKYNKLNNNLL